MTISQEEAQQLLTEFGGDGLLAIGVSSEQLALIEEAALTHEAAASPAITELPGGGGIFDTATGQIITYDPIASIPFQQPGQVYTTTIAGQVDPNAPATLDGVVYATYQEALSAQARVLPGRNLLKRPGQVISATVFFDYTGEASNLEVILSIGDSVGRTTAHVPNTGQQTASVATSFEVNAPQVLGVHSAEVQILWRGELLASAIASQLVEVQG